MFILLKIWKYKNEFISKNKISSVGISFKFYMIVARVTHLWKLWKNGSKVGFELLTYLSLKWK